MIQDNRHVEMSKQNKVPRGKEDKNKRAQDNDMGTKGERREKEWEKEMRCNNIAIALPFYICKFYPASIYNVTLTR